MHELSPNEVRTLQLSQVSEVELSSLRNLRQVEPLEHVPISMNQAIEQAKDHVFERKAVVSDYELIAETIRSGYGDLSLAEVQKSVAHGQHGLLVPVRDPYESAENTNRSVDRARSRST